MLPNKKRLQLEVGRGREHAEEWRSRLRDPPNSSQLQLGWSATVDADQPKRKPAEAFIVITKTKQLQERDAVGGKKVVEDLAAARGRLQELREAQA